MERLSDSPEQYLASAGTEVGNEPKSIDREQPANNPSPIHPIPQLQGPFEESIHEALQGADSEWIVELDAQSRRRDLIENPKYERLCGRKWRQRAGERYHPLWKLTAQMSFGLHLLVKGIAKSDTQVLKILQAHVDEVDGFISRTSEDFLIIQIDLRTRIQYLSLPLKNLDVFDEMLEDRTFRLSMVDYNEKIEHAIDRFTAVINDALKDIQKGKEAISGLWQFLGQSTAENAPLPTSLAAVYSSMLANTEGWNSTFSNLRRKGTALQYALCQLGRAIAEMQRRVGVASRKDMVSFMQTYHEPLQAKLFRGRLFERRSSMTGSKSLGIEKPLPRDPTLSKGSLSKPAGSNNHRRLAQKSVPNLRAIKEFDERRDTEIAASRAKSVNGASDDVDSSGLLPRIQKNLGRRLSRAILPMKKSTEEGTEEPLSRPSTAASRTLMSIRKGKLGQQQQQSQKQQQHPELPPHPRSHWPCTSNASTKGETMKDQFLHYFKSDRVVDAWESATQGGEKVDRTHSQRKRDGIRSKFHTKPSIIPSDILQANLFQDDLHKQMAWLDEETRALNTYSLKPKHDTAPRVHTISVHMSFHQQLDDEERYLNNAGYLKPRDADAQSIITALPAFPLPPTTHPLPKPTTVSS